MPTGIAPCSWRRRRRRPTNCVVKAKRRRPTIYAKAFSQDPHFFAVWRTLQGYRAAFDTGHARLVLTPDNEYLRYLQKLPVPGVP